MEASSAARVTGDSAGPDAWTDAGPASDLGGLGRDQPADTESPRGEHTDAGDRNADGSAPALALPPVDPANLHASAVVVDLHVDTLWQMHSKRRGPNHPALQASPAQLDTGGVDVQFFSVWVPPEEPHAFRTAMALIDLFERDILGGGRVLAGSAAEAVELVRRGDKVAVLGLEGAVALEGRAEAVDAFHARGVRYVALTWNESNPFGAGADQLVGGATPLGLALVRRLDALRVMVDVSHANPETFWDVLTVATRPVMASHSNAFAVHPHRRNLNDVQLWALAEGGGVVGLNLHGRFLGDRRVTLADVLAHARHVRAVGGPALLALGTDFDGQIRAPGDLRRMGQLPALTAALEADGWGAQETAGVLGHNFVRAMHEVEAGPSGRRATHRPAAIADVSSTAPGTAAALAFDTVATTGWSAPDGEPTGHALAVTVIGPDVDRVGLCASTVAQTSGVREVEVRVRTDGGKMLGTYRLALSPAVRLHRLDLPAAGIAQVIHVDIELVDVQAGPPMLAEVVFERRVRPLPP